jgi:hypothetical protein
MRRMGILGWGLVVLCTACGASRSAVVKEPVEQAAPEAPQPRGEQLRPFLQEARAPSRRYVDEDLGFEIVRATTEWQLTEREEQRSPEGLSIPVVLRHRMSHAEVVLQVAPAVASPVQFAERLNAGLREQPGFVATELEPLPLSDSAVGFHFEVAQDGKSMRGRVAVTEGSPGHVFMMLATWPVDAPEGVAQSVDALFGAVRPLPERG